MQKKQQPTKTQIEVLMSDWLGNLREEGTFIHKDTKGMIKNTVRKGSSFSDYFLGDTSVMPQEDILRQAREIAQGVVSGMTDESIKVVLGNSDSFTNGKSICVATDYFDNPTLSLGEKVDILTGYSIHEACHIKHSDFAQLKEIKEKSTDIANFKLNIMNILEDERIEMLLGESVENGGDGMPGLSDYLGICKKQCFGSFERELKKEQVEIKDRVPKFLNALVRAVRFPTALTEQEVIDNFDELDAVRKVLTPFPKSPIGVEHAADKIIDIMKDMIKKDLNEKQQQQQQQKQSNDQEEQKQNENGQRSGSPDQKQENPQGENSGQKPQGGQSFGQSGSGPTKKEIEKELSKALQNPNTQKLLNQIKKCIKQPEGGSAEKNASSLKGYNSEAKTDYVNGDCEKAEGAGGINEIAYVRKVKGNKDNYNDALRKVKKWVPAMAKALRCKTIDRDYELMGMPSGKLNTNKLVSLKTGNVNIFTKSGSITTDSACICILIDESGSMNRERLLGARNTAVLINEAVKHIPNLELFVYGFTDNELTIYCERKNADRWALGSTRAKGGTPTGEAMRVAAARVRKMTQSNCLMLVITDGCPNDSLATIEQDKILSKKGFVPVGVDIAGANQVKTLFKESVSTSDMQKLAPNIGQIVKKKLLRSIKSYDSN